MFESETGKWRATPPDYECILVNKPTKEGVISGKRSNLDDYIDMTSAGGGDEESPMGIVYSLGDFRGRFCL